MQVVVSGILTNYQAFGQGKETILILHGWQRSLEDWLPIAKQLASNHRVIVLDLPGMGATPASGHVQDTYDYAKFITSFMDKLELSSVILIGHSFGGRLGIILAAQTDRVSKLILVDSAGIEQKSLMVKAKIWWYRHLLKPLKKLVPLGLVVIMGRGAGSRDYQQSAGLRPVLTRVVNQDLRYLLPQISIPTSIIWGERDQALPIWHAKLMRSLIPNSTLRIVWGAGHLPYLDQARQFTTILREYVA
jgi:pimeloyl-ACP methyl ester carboxylesterase